MNISFDKSLWMLICSHLAKLILGTVSYTAMLCYAALCYAILLDRYTGRDRSSMYLKGILCIEVWTKRFPELAKTN